MTVLAGPRVGGPETSALELTRAARLAAVLLALAAPAAVRGASISIEGGAVVLGRTQSSQVIIRVDEPPGAETRPLRLSVNVGQFTEPVRLGPGKYRAVYTPPATRFPQVALVAVWRESGSDARIDFLRFPLFGMTRVPVSAKPTAQVTARVGLDTFGPFAADRRGRAEVPVHVEPGVRRCDLTIRETGGGQVTRHVDLEVPPYNRLTAALVPHAVLADGRSPVKLEVFYDLGGSNVPPERIQVVPSLGKVAFERAARGLYTYRYVPPADTTVAAVTFTVSVAGDPEARASTRLSLGLPPPAQLVATAPSRRLQVGSGDTAPVSVLVMDAAGLGLPGMTVSATANGRPLAAPVYRGAGLYEFTFEAPSAYPPGGLVQLRATAVAGAARVETSLNWQLDAASLPSSASARVTPAPVPADGRTQAKVLLEVRDAAGRPLERARLIAVASHGSLGRVEERGNGIYAYDYLPPASMPDAPVVIRVTDESGAFERSFPVPIRQDTRRLLVGLGGGYAHSGGDASGPRASAELWVPFAAGGARLGAGLALGYGTASRTVRDVDGTLESDTRAVFVPVTVKLGWEVFAGRRLSVVAGAGGVGTFGAFSSTLGESQRGFGLGWMGFADLGWSVGPGQAVLQVSYGSAPAETTDYRIDPAGPSAVLSYRVGVF